ncbi:hypothetical protein TNCV_308731 [Trichonephila clavipes]|nr:hypothetical protein TNCV_308731 [Trichonephila clavipes]
MDGAMFFFLTSPIFLFIRIKGVFSSGGNVAVGIILRSCTKVSDLAVEECWCMVASPLKGRTDLYIIRYGPLTARRYRDEILRPIVVPYGAEIGDDFILMDVTAGHIVLTSCRIPFSRNESNEWNGQRVLQT